LIYTGHLLLWNSEMMGWAYSYGGQEQKYVMNFCNKFCFDINKIQQDATVCRYLFTASLLYTFRASIAPIIRSTKNFNCSLWYRLYYV